MQYLDPNFGYYCEDDPESLSVTCCWKETDEEGISIDYCQNCNIDTEKGDITNDCGEKHPRHLSPPTTNENIAPEDGKIIDQTKQSNTNPPLNDQRVPAGNVSVLEQLEATSNNQDNGQEDSVSSNPGLVNVLPQNPPS